MSKCQNKLKSNVLLWVAPKLPSKMIHHVPRPWLKLLDWQIGWLQCFIWPHLWSQSGTSILNYSFGVMAGYNQMLPWNHTLPGLSSALVARSEPIHLRIEHPCERRSTSSQFASGQKRWRDSKFFITWKVDESRTKDMFDLISKWHSFFGWISLVTFFGCEFSCSFPWATK